MCLSIQTNHPIRANGLAALMVFRLAALGALTSDRGAEPWKCFSWQTLTLICSSGYGPEVCRRLSDRKVLSVAQGIWEDGYANATLTEHVGANLLRILTRCVVAVLLGIPVGLLMGLALTLSCYFLAPGSCRRAPELPATDGQPCA